MTLETFEVELQNNYIKLVAQYLPWPLMVRQGYLYGIPFLAEFKALARKHMKHMAEEIMRQRESIINDLLSDVHVVVATCDAWCKFKSGCLKGSIGRAVQALTMIVALIDEMEAYDPEPIIGGFAGGTVQTLVLMGDENQRLENRHPAYTRAPWVKPNQELDLEEADDDDNAQASGCGPSPTVNPRKRPFTEWLPSTNVGKLSECIRCGPSVCELVKQLYKLPDFQSSPEAPDTWLWHVFYDGNGWVQSPIPQKGHAASRMLGWHGVLFGSLLEMIIEDLRWLNTQQGARTEPKVLIVCPLARVGLPLSVLCSCLWDPKEVRVVLTSAARGRSCDFVHAIRHRRYLDKPDQYNGLQADFKRDYICYTRGRLNTVMWLEKQPYGAPFAERMPPNSKHVPAREHSKLLNAILPQGWFWRVLDGKGDWRHSYEQAFECNVDSRDVEEIARVLGECWDKCSDPASHLPRIGTPADQYDNLFVALEALLSGENSDDVNLQVWGQFITAARPEVRAKGFDQSAAEHFRPLPDNPDVNPWDQDFFGYARGFGLLIAPCCTVELSAHPDKGLTRVAAPFMAPEKFGVKDDVEPMLTSFAVVVWRMCKVFQPDLIEGAQLRLAHHKAEVFKEDSSTDWWLNKSCESNRRATVILHPWKRGEKSAVENLPRRWRS